MDISDLPLIQLKKEEDSKRVAQAWKGIPELMRHSYFIDECEKFDSYLKKKWVYEYVLGESIDKPMGYLGISEFASPLQFMKNIRNTSEAIDLSPEAMRRISVFENYTGALPVAEVMFESFLTATSIKDMAAFFNTPQLPADLIDGSREIKGPYEGMKRRVHRLPGDPEISCELIRRASALPYELLLVQVASDRLDHAVLLNHMGFSGVMSIPNDDKTENMLHIYALPKQQFRSDYSLEKQMFDAIKFS